MSVNLEVKAKYINELSKIRKRSWVKKGKIGTSSVVLTNNSKYYGMMFCSPTHILNVTSESCALAKAVSNKDPNVYEVITLAEDDYKPCPLVLKILADHVRRTGINIKYSAYNIKGENLFSISNVMGSYYKPEIKPLEKIKEWKKEKCYEIVKENVEEQLKECALKGMQTHFSSNTKTLYGAAVLVRDRIYFGGVYSSYEHRLNLHAEMVSVLNAFSDGYTKIEKVAIVSTKFVNTLPQACGCCRQFLTEIQQINKNEIEILCFPIKGEMFKISLKKYFPYSWDPEVKK